MLKSLQARLDRLESGRHVGLMELLIVLAGPANAPITAGMLNGPLVEALARIERCESNQEAEQC